VQSGTPVHTDNGEVSTPMRPATDAEMGLVLGAKYESDLLIHGAQARRRFHTAGILIAIAVAVFAYDAVSLLIAR